MKRLAILAMAVVAITASAAFSQTAPVTPAPGLLETVQPALKTIADAAITLLAGALIWFIKVKWGIDLSSFRQSTFQIASTNAAGIYKSTGDMSRAVDYLKGAAPEAIHHFDLADSQLPEKIEAKAGILEASGTVIPVMPGVVEQKLTGR